MFNLLRLGDNGSAVVPYIQYNDPKNFRYYKIQDQDKALEYSQAISAKLNVENVIFFVILTPDVMTCVWSLTTRKIRVEVPSFQLNDIGRINKAAQDNWELVQQLIPFITLAPPVQTLLRGSYTITGANIYDYSFQYFILNGGKSDFYIDESGKAATGKNRFTIHYRALNPEEKSRVAISLVPSLETLEIKILRARNLDILNQFIDLFDNVLLE